MYRIAVFGQFTNTYLEIPHPFVKTWDYYRDIARKLKLLRTPNGTPRGATPDL